jgi:hypothetical protein
LTAAPQKETQQAFVQPELYAALVRGGDDESHQTAKNSNLGIPFLLHSISRRKLSYVCWRTDGHSFEWYI